MNTENRIIQAFGILFICFLIMTEGNIALSFFLSSVSILVVIFLFGGDIDDNNK